MVKSGGTKRKIKMEKIPRRDYLATAFTKRSFGLYSKASQLCLLTGAQIAILATPASSQSNVSFYSFGHSSVDAIVSAFLRGQHPVPVPEETREEDIGICMARKELGLELWWESEGLSKSQNPQELMDAVNSMSRMLNALRSGDFVNKNNQRDAHHQSFVNDEDLEDNEMTKIVLHQGTQDTDETLNLQSNSAICCIPDDFAESDDDLPDKTTEEQGQILAICDSFCATENNNNNALRTSLDVYNQEMDQLIDFGTTFGCSASDAGFLESTQELQETAGSLLINFEAAHDVSANPNPPIYDSEGVEDEALVFQNKALDEDNLNFEVANDVSTNPNPISDAEGVEDEALAFQNRDLD